MTTSLRVLDPMSVTRQQIESTNVPDSALTEWNAGATYSINAEVKKGDKTFVSVRDSNVNHDPESPASDTWWRKSGVINMMRPFDPFISTKVKQADQIAYTFKMGRAATSVSVLGVEGATSITLRIENAGETIQTHTVQMQSVPTRTGLWYWLYGQRLIRTEARFFDLPTYPNAKLHITINGTTDLAVGVIAIGNMQEFGYAVLSGAEIGIDDYSKDQPDDFGVRDIVLRSWAKRTSIDLLIRDSEIDNMQRFIAGMRGKYAIWIGSGRFESTTIYGLARNFRVVLSGADHATCQLTLLGMNEE